MGCTRLAFWVKARDVGTTNAGIEFAEARSATRLRGQTAIMG